MSIGRRFLDMARAELNSLLDFAGKRGDADDDRPGDDGLHGYSARELEEELERRRSARQEVEDAIHGRRGPESERKPDAPANGSADRGSARGGARGGARGSAASRAPSEVLRVQRAYATLEVAVGSDFETVRTAYRALMRKYHPDHHTESPEKQKAANEVAQGLTEAYKVLEAKLRR
jgi:DnaJ-domain-containing protein 1